MKTMEELSETFNTLYSCKSCGGICQIKEDMVTDGQQAIARIKGREGEYLKECPYCKKRTVFRKVTDGI